ncbi:hypothetical protein ACLBWZ_11155 [Brucellaceae bacterium C25G]
MITTPWYLTIFLLPVLYPQTAMIIIVALIGSGALLPLKQAVRVTIHTIAAIILLLLLFGIAMMY